MKLLIDMNLSPRWETALRSIGVEAEHWSVVGKATASDREIFAFAEENGWTIFTNDLDFGAILAITRGTKPSVIQIRGADVRPEAGLDVLALALSTCQNELESGALLTIDAARLRVALLPLQS